MAPKSLLNFTTTILILSLPLMVIAGERHMWELPQFPHRPPYWPGFFPKLKLPGFPKFVKIPTMPPPLLSQIPNMPEVPEMPNYTFSANNPSIASPPPSPDQ